MNIRRYVSYYKEGDGGGSGNGVFVDDIPRSVADQAEAMLLCMTYLLDRYGSLVGDKMHRLPLGFELVRDGMTIQVIYNIESSS